MLAALTATALTGGCSRELTAKQARMKADEVAGSEFHIADFDGLRVVTTEKPSRWEIGYYGGKDAAGGWLVLGVDKETGRVEVLDLAQ